MECLLPFFGEDLDLTNPFWYCSELYETKGVGVDEATVIIPCSSIIESAWQGVLNPSGAYSYLKQGMFCAIRKKWTDSLGEVHFDLKMVGIIDEIAHDIDRLCLVVKIQSVKNKLRDVRLLGSWWWDGEKVIHQSGFPLDINPGGKPNCLWYRGRIPVVVQPDYGLAEDQEPAGPFERSSEVASYWTLQGLLLYAFYFAGPELVDEALLDAWTVANTITPGLQRCPSWLLWPETFGSDVDLEFVLNWNTGVGQNNTSRGGARKGRPLKFANGVALIGDTQGVPGFLDLVFGAAGGWDYHFEFVDGGGGVFVNVLKSVPTRWSSNVGKKPMPYGVGAAALAFKSPCLNAGSYVESSRELYNRVVGVASKIKIETRVAWDGTYILATCGEIAPRWTQEEFNSVCRDAVTLAGGTPTPQSFKDALRAHPDVLDKWVFNPNFNYYANTGLTAQATQTPPFLPPLALPFLLSFAGAKSILVANDIVHFQVRVEVSVPVAPALNPAIRQWVALPDENGLVCWENGVMQFEGLRRIGIEFGDTSPGLFNWFPVAARPPKGIQYQVSSGFLNIAVNPIRFTIAIASGSALMRAWQSMGGQTDGGGLFQFETDSPDAAKFDQTFERTAVLDLAGLYELWIRLNSFPLPQSASGVLAEDKKLNDPLRDDRDLMDAHVIKGLHERHRLDRSRSLPTMMGFLADGWPVGTQIDTFYPVDPDVQNLPFTARAIVAGRRYRCTQIGEGESATFENSTEHQLV